MYSSGAFPFTNFNFYLVCPPIPRTYEYYYHTTRRKN